MPRRTIIVEGDDIIIDLGRRRRSDSQVSENGSNSAREELPQKGGQESPPTEGNEIHLSQEVLTKMELRAESSFRPNQNDYEVLYALTGTHPWRPDYVHALASQSVVQDAREDTVIPIMDGIIEYIQAERSEDSVKIVVLLHTHPAPGNIAEPSSNDMRFFDFSAKAIKDVFPEAKVFFGVHAISGDMIRNREGASLMAENKIRWTSVKREHEVGFFTSKSERQKVVADE